MKTMTKHLRYVVKVHGNKPIIYYSREYYTRLPQMAEKLAEEWAEKVIISSQLGKPNTELVRIVCPNRNFAEELGARIRSLRKYPYRVEVRLGLVQLS